ncbi:MAG: hypothetical protein J3Q66DRAFT_404948 [Benniella sp.]|nr:MAG: hypothetical protein J3Q66DRAFT_404948 [Benniella sp.]
MKDIVATALTAILSRLSQAFQALELTNLYLENAYKTADDDDIALLLCHDAELALFQVKNANKKIYAPPGDTNYQVLRDGVAAAYADLGKLLERKGYLEVTYVICKTAEKWGGSAHHPGRLARSIQPSNTAGSTEGSQEPDGGSNTACSANATSASEQGQSNDIAIIDPHIFPVNVRPPTIDVKLPESDERLNSTPQLVCCLSLLKAARLPDFALDPAADKWLQLIDDTDEQNRLQMMATEVVRAYKRDETKDAKIVTEVVYLAPVLNKDTYQDLLREFYTGIDHSGLLDVHQIEGIAQLIQDGGPGYLDADDLVKILGLLSVRLRGTHQQSTQHLQQLTVAVSHVHILDDMADARGIRETGGAISTGGFKATGVIRTT